MLKAQLTVIGILSMLAAQSLLGQTAAAPLEFEVASVKQAAPITPAMVASGKFHTGTKIDGVRADIGNMRLMSLITEAYGVKQYQIVGPSWLAATQDAFDVVATLPKGATEEQLPLMLQAMLADRFKLAIHRETKEMPVYALVVGKNGPKLTAAADAAPEPAVADSQSSKAVTLNGGNGKQKQPVSQTPDGQFMHIEQPMSMTELAAALAPFADRPVLDMTGIKGRYKVSMDISMQAVFDMFRAAGAAVPSSAGDTGNPSDAVSEPGGGSVFAAARSLGLNLEPRKAPVQVIVVDQLERMPTQN